MALAMACGIDNLECKVNDPRGETLEYWEQIKNVGIPAQKFIRRILFTSLFATWKNRRTTWSTNTMSTLLKRKTSKKLGPAKIAERALQMLDHCDLIYVSFDVDSLDSRISTGTGTPVPNGLTVEEAKILNAELAKNVKGLCLGNCRSESYARYRKQNGRKRF